MPKTKTTSEDADIKRFEKFVKELLGKDDAELFLEKYGEQWNERIERDEPELDSFVLKAIEFDNASCAIILMNDWMRFMNKVENYEKWKKNSPVQKQDIIEDYYFQIKADFFRASLEKYGGRKGVEDKLLALNGMLRKKNFEDASKQSKTLLKILDDNPFVSNESFQYVSIMNEMEWFVYQHYNKSSNSNVRNINFICPVEYIYLENAAIAFEMKKYSEAEKYLNETLKWNPVSAYGLWFLARVYLERRQWKQSLDTIIRGLKYAYRPSHFRAFYDALMCYFDGRNLNKDVLCCIYLKMQYVSSDKTRKNVAQDFQIFSRSERTTNLRVKKLCDAYIKPLEEPGKRNNRTDSKSSKLVDVSIEDVRESSRKYGYPMEVNPKIIELAKSCREKAVCAKDNREAEYFQTILSDLEKCREQAKRIGVAISRQRKSKVVS